MNDELVSIILMQIVLILSLFVSLINGWPMFNDFMGVLSFGALIILNLMIIDVHFFVNKGVSNNE